MIWNESVDACRRLVAFVPWGDFCLKAVVCLLVGSGLEMYTKHNHNNLSYTPLLLNSYIYS